ncbi:ATP-binding protein [Sphingomonas morindae]|uniref:ATP-binding protein n=1 Tax=Sphingomonas morindae TaxID=1541170 RepID=A0ABY4X8Z5_9SPHN|nr:ATP-binding protein [Sphingomonas morindae]USI73339.1 ATP-binding protein [Sphingomonas morindae]
MSEHSLSRIAAALERLSPPPPPAADPLAHPAYVWREGTLVAARAFRPLALELLTGVDRQKAALVENMRRLAAGLPAHDVLLWGARGTGKSSLVKSAVGALQADGAALALVEVAPDALAALPHLFDLVAEAPRAFALFVDDLGFEEDGAGARTLRSLLEGGAEARPDNARLHVTANRRHIVTREFGEAERAVNARDVLDDRLALADRFGLSLGFHAIDQTSYLAMVEAYARARGLPFEAADAIAWATGRGARSGRVAWQYVVELAGREGRTL